MAAKPIWLALALAVLCLCGCDVRDKNTARVTGTVTFQGLPAVAEVLFEPLGKGGGRPSTGFTNKEGWFELEYAPAQRGASVGDHRVTIKVFGNTKTLLTEERADPIKIVFLRRKVDPGKNTFNFAILY